MRLDHSDTNMVVRRCFDLGRSRRQQPGDECVQVALGCRHHRIDDEARMAVADVKPDSADRSVVGNRQSHALGKRTSCEDRSVEFALNVVGVAVDLVPPGSFLGFEDTHDSVQVVRTRMAQLHLGLHHDRDNGRA